MNKVSKCSPLEVIMFEQKNKMDTHESIGIHFQTYY